MLKTYFLDVDECSENLHLCHNRANCTNTNGSYNCTCMEGIFGNGFLCSGEIMLFEVL